MKYKYDCDEISRMAQGRWIEIFKELAGHSSEVQQAIDNLGTTRHTSCPIHGGKTVMYIDYSLIFQKRECLYAIRAGRSPLFPY